MRLSGVDPATVESVLTLDWQQGSAATLSGIGERGAVVDDAWAKANDVEVGDTLRVRTPKETTVDFTVRGTVKDNADLFGNMLVDVATLRADFGREAPSQAFLALAPGANADRVQERVDRTIGRAYPTVEVENQQQLKDRQAAQIDQLLEPRLRPAVPGGPGRAVRDRQHARALDPRAHARAGDAARRRACRAARCAR